MADNVAITAGSGTSIAADDIGSVFYQRVKISIGADGSAADIAGDTGNGIDVDVTRLSALVAGEAFIGFVGSKQKVVSTNFTRPANTTAYAAGDAVTNSTSAPVIMTFDAVARANAGSGTVIGASLVDSANQTTKGQFELWLFDTTVTPDNDNAVFTPTDAECATLIGIVQFNLPFVGDATAGAGGNVVYIVNNLSIPFTTGASVDDIFGLLVVRNAYTPVSAGVFTVRLQVIQN
jgi:hypothetical protein